jgi:hypothetical protein
MSYDDERQHPESKAHLVMSTGSGKTLSMIAYWHLMQTPMEGEEGPGGTVDERFTPVPDEELERRLAALDELTVSPLPADIEGLSNSGRFLREPEAEDARVLGERKQDVHSSSSEKGSHQGASPRLMRVYHGASSRTSTSNALKWFAAQLRRPGQWEEAWQEARHNYSAVLLVCAGENDIGTLKMKRSETPPTSWGDRCDWLAYLADSRVVKRHREFTRDAEHSRATLRYLSYDSLSPYGEFLRDAVRTYFTLHVSITVVVDNVGAARDPNAALNSLIAEATSFSAAEVDDGTWTLLVTAPAVAGERSHTMGRPRLAVLELPGDPPPEPRNLNNTAQSAKLLRAIRNVLEDI